MIEEVGLHDSFGVSCHKTKRMPYFWYIDYVKVWFVTTQVADDEISK